MTADSKGTMLRVRAELERLRASVESLALNIAVDGSAAEASRSVADTAIRMVALCAVLEAQRRAERVR